MATFLRRAADLHSLPLRRRGPYRSSTTAVRLGRLGSRADSSTLGGQAQGQALRRPSPGRAILADPSTCFACCVVSSQCTDSRSASGRSRCGIGFTPSRLQTSPPTRPRHDPPAASTAIIACTSTPYTLPRFRRGRLFFTGQRPQRRWAVVGNFTSLRSPDHVRGRLWIARTCRPAQASTARSAQPAQAHRFARYHLFESLPSGLP